MPAVDAGPDFRFDRQDHEASQSPAGAADDDPDPQTRATAGLA
jgi:hypothetical protein